MTLQLELVAWIREMHSRTRDVVLNACEEQGEAALSEVERDTEGDTIYRVDAVGEERLFEDLERGAAEFGGVVAIAEGIEGGGKRVFPRGQDEATARLRMIIDPIDGTRGIMYQKRSAWILTGVAPNRGTGTKLSDIEIAVQTELPILKQNRSDQLWATRGRGAEAVRYDRDRKQEQPLALSPSRARTVRHGYAGLTRFFAGARDVLAEIDDELMIAAAGPLVAGKALCFEDQYTSTGGQLYELIVGHDRFQADLRPLLHDVLIERGRPRGLCCHPYDLAASLIACEAGVLLTGPDGNPFDAPMDVDTDVAWVGYANEAIRLEVEPSLHASLRRRGMLRA